VNNIFYLYKMIINTSEISLKSENESFKVRHATESVKFWVENPVNKPTPASTQKSDFKDNAKNDTKSSGDAKLDLKIKLLEQILKEVYNSEFDTIYADYSKANEKVNELNRSSNALEPDWRIKYQRQELLYENQSSKFNAEGKIKTSDGKQIDFSLQLNMEFNNLQISNQSLEISKQRKDPMVINFDGKADLLDFEKFEFDLENNGLLYSIPFLKGGKGYLAIDNNKDGKVNNGSELIGALNGDAFAELKRMDYDNNNWIDEKDSAYSKLGTWEIHQNGYNRLTPLKQRGVEAIYLGNVVTNFYERNLANEKLGEIKKTSVFVNNNHQVRTTHQLDFLL